MPLHVTPSDLEWNPQPRALGERLTAPLIAYAYQRRLLAAAAGTRSEAGDVGMSSPSCGGAAAAAMGLFNGGNR